MFDIDADKSAEEILKDIRTAAIQGFNQNNPNFVFPPLAALLVKLSYAAKNTADEAVRTADKTLPFTKWLFWATIVLLAATILLVVLEIMKSHEPSNGNAKTEQTQAQNPMQIPLVAPPVAPASKGKL